MPYPEYPPVIGHLLPALEIHDLLLHDFDWQAWGAEAEYFEESAALAIATLTEVRQLLTLHARMERFADGHLAEQLARGRLSALRRRLAEGRVTWLTACRRGLAEEPHRPRRPGAAMNRVIHSKLCWFRRTPCQGGGPA